MSRGILHAQEDRLMRAQTLYGEKKIELAQICIDSVVVDPETKNRFEAWTIRGFVYFELYKATEKKSLDNPLRDTIVASLKRSYALKPDEQYKQNNDKLLQSISSHYYNIVGVLLQDSLNYERSNLAFTKFVELQKLLGNDALIKEKSLEYYLAVGSLFSSKFNNDQTDTKSFEVAKVALMKVLDADSKNASANMNMGIMYLNQATQLVQNIEFGEVNIDDLDIVQENAAKLAKQAEQFILKVYNQDQKNPKAVLSMYYIYRVLYENQKMADFEKKCKELKIEISGDKEQK
ncbi:MAG: hypothetical protein AB7O73_13225 [Bacteroidia bacterium]